MPYADKKKQSEYHKQWYERHKDQYKSSVRERNKNYKHRNREFVRRVKQLFACADCNMRFHYSQMDFDHIDGKEENISRMMNQSYSLEKIKKEIRKCELVCSNCHRLRTWSRLQ